MPSASFVGKTNALIGTDPNMGTCHLWGHSKTQFETSMTTLPQIPICHISPCHLHSPCCCEGACNSIRHSKSRHVSSLATSVVDLGCHLVLFDWDMQNSPKECWLILSPSRLKPVSPRLQLSCFSIWHTTAILWWSSEPWMAQASELPTVLLDF